MVAMVAAGCRAQAAAEACAVCEASSCAELASQCCVCAYKSRQRSRTHASMCLVGKTLTCICHVGDGKTRTHGDCAAIVVPFSRGCNLLTVYSKKHIDSVKNMLPCMHACVLACVRVCACVRVRVLSTQRLSNS